MKPSATELIGFLALSIALACPELRVLSAVTLANMARVELPATVARVILCADNDADNPSAAALLARAAERFAAEGRGVRIARPVPREQRAACVRYALRIL